MTETSKNLIDRICEVTADVRKSFGDLATEQLNWKPSPEEWSVAQCLDHLVTTNEAYFVNVEQAAGDDFRPNIWSRVPFWSGLVGYLLRRAVDPDSRRKVKTFGLFEPAASDVPDTIVEDFAECQKKLMGLVRQTDHLNRAKIKISSPVSEKVTLSLANAFEIIVIHERRHYYQALEVMGHESFPSSG